MSHWCKHYPVHRYALKTNPVEGILSLQLIMAEESWCRLAMFMYMVIDTCLGTTFEVSLSLHVITSEWHELYIDGGRYTSASYKCRNL